MMMEGKSFYILLSKLLVLTILLFCCSNYNVKALSRNLDSLDSDTINVYLIAHSHCDVGWVQTYEQYYTENVTHILTNVVNALIGDETKKFIWAEIIYFERWWNDQTTMVQAQVRQLVLNGQLEFVGGGWAQNDEAVAHYQAIVNQMTIGHQFLLGTFGVTPVVGWQIDPFGPSTMTAQLFKLMGFKYHVINRLDDRIKHIYNDTPDIIGSGIMTNNRSFEFIWYPSVNYNQYSQDFSIFTHVLDDHYNSPSICWPNATNPNASICTGFDFEGDPTQNPPINDTNIDFQAGKLVELIQQRAAYYRHNNLLLPFGNDFRYQNADIEFDNMDKLIAYINANETFNVKIQYATLTDYFNEVMETTGDDPDTFFPSIVGLDYYTYTMCLASDYQNFNTCVNYWAGYFTSYPVLKQTIRESDRLLRSAEIFFSLGTAVINGNHTFSYDQCYNALAYHRNVSGILTHHDAVTGTAKAYVRANYLEMLDDAQNQTLTQVLPAVVGLLMANRTVEMGYTGSIDALSNLTVGQVVVVSFTNSLGWNRVEYVRLSVGIENYAVYNSQQQPIVSQIVERIDDGSWELLFQVEVSALGISSYFIVCIGDLDANGNLTPIQRAMFKDLEVGDPIIAYRSLMLGREDIDLTETISIGNNIYSLDFRLNPSGLLQLYVYNDLVQELSYALSQQLFEYHSMNDDCYKFRPYGPALPVAATSPQFYLTIGPLAQIITIVYSNNVSQVFTVYNETSLQSGSGAQESQYISIENIVAAGWDREIVMRFTTSIDNNQTFYSNNGLEAMQRTYQMRFNDSFPWSMVAGNYFPSINMAKIQDSSTELVILNDQSMGVSSQYPGTLECMLIRRSNYTQGSIHEKMNDTSVAHIHHRILFGSIGIREVLRSPHSIVHENRLLPLFAPVEDSIGKYAFDHHTTFTPFPDDSQFPSNLHLMSLNKQWSDNPGCVMRIVNIYEVEQGGQFYGQPSTIPISSLFTQFNISNVQETTLTANNVINDMNVPLTVTVDPISIRTFVFDFNPLIDMQDQEEEETSYDDHHINPNTNHNTNNNKNNHMSIN